MRNPAHLCETIGLVATGAVTQADRLVILDAGKGAGDMLWLAIAAFLVSATARAVPVPIVPDPIDPAVAAWLFPPVPARTGTVDAVTPLSVPGSTLHYTEAQLHDLSSAVDWQPASHAPLPPAVAHGEGTAFACGACHMPGGEGRPENASLAGLAPNYIERQVAAFADGTRRAALPDWGPSKLMALTAHNVTPAAVHVAALYFNAIRFVSRVRVVESAMVPAPATRAFLFMPTAGGVPEPIGNRIVETPVDFERFERRDPNVGFIAYVPPGSLVRGKAVMAHIGCPACHGTAVRGWGAGRSPSYIVRQLLAFQSGARHDAAAAPMTAVTGKLSMTDMVDVAAYWASLKP